MQAPTVTLSLQFARFPNVAKHRAALPRHKVTRCVKHALQINVESMEITLRIVDETEGRALNASYRHKDYATNVLGSMLKLSTSCLGKRTVRVSFFK